MKKSNISYTKNHLSELINQVREGESILIMDRHTPVARLEPVNYTNNDQSSWLEEKIRRDILSPPRKKHKKSLLAGWNPVKTRTGVDPLDILTNDREDRV